MFLYEVQGELLLSSRSSTFAYVYAFLSHCVKVLYASFSKGHISEPLIRKHSYLEHRYPGWSLFIPWLLTPGFMPRVEAGGQKLGHL